MVSTAHDVTERVMTPPACTLTGKGLLNADDKASAICLFVIFTLLSTLATWGFSSKIHPKIGFFPSLVSNMFLMLLMQPIIFCARTIFGSSCMGDYVCQNKADKGDPANYQLVTNTEFNNYAFVRMLVLATCFFGMSYLVNTAGSYVVSKELSGIVTKITQYLSITDTTTVKAKLMFAGIAASSAFIADAVTIAFNKGAAE